MTDHVKGFVVVLDTDLREDDAEHIRKSIAMLRYVADVQLVKEGIDDQLNRMKVRSELISKLWDVLK